MSNYVGSSSHGAIYGASVTPSSTNYAIAWNVNGADCEINGTTSSSLSVNNANIATATASGLSVVGSISEGGIALSTKYLGINGTASNASALGGVAADVKPTVGALGPAYGIITRVVDVTDEPGVTGGTIVTGKQIGRAHV